MTMTIKFFVMWKVDGEEQCREGECACKDVELSQENLNKLGDEILAEVGRIEGWKQGDKVVCQMVMAIEKPMGKTQSPEGSSSSLRREALEEMLMGPDLGGRPGKMSVH